MSDHVTIKGKKYYEEGYLLLANNNTRRSISKRTKINATDPVKEALDLAYRYGSIDGGHHKMWVIDQMVRALTGDGYGKWVQEHNLGEDGPETYSWDRGIAP